jgi:hypothetical protein
MFRYLDRIRRGERCWTAEIVLRGIGIILLGGCYKLGLLANRILTVPPPHQATPGEFALCTALFLALTSGLALTFVGPGLFAEVPIPQNSAHFPRTRMP